ncbi:MAG: hypothetical protein CSB47_09565 [Proteobacteria bacterium]|nr:MAG: hypothetical protein CSB47_09565 [Pseudomonadota bacterium]
MRFAVKIILFVSLICLLGLGAFFVYTKLLRPNRIPHQPPSAEALQQLLKQKQHTRYLLGTNTNEVTEDNASVPFVDLFKSSIPFPDTYPWLSSKQVRYDKHGWPIELNGGVAGTKFLNRLPAGTVPDGQYTVLYDGEGKIDYGNDARLVSRDVGKDLIQIKVGKDRILNASLIIKQLNKKNPLRNIRVLLPGGICQNNPFKRIDSQASCTNSRYLPFAKNDGSILFNPDYLNFMKDFRLIRFMNMSGMTRNPVTEWRDRNTLSKATWAGKEGNRGAPVEIMVALANQLKSDAWFSMPYKASDDYVRHFARYVAQHLDPSLRVYIEYSNEVWNNIFPHRRYAIEQGLSAKLDTHPETAGIKYYAIRSVEIFKTWEQEFGDKSRLVNVISGWSANPRLTSQLLSYRQTHQYTDALAIAPYFYADLDALRKAKRVDDIFKAVNDTGSRYGLPAAIRQIKQQAALTKEFGVELIAYEGGQHLVDWETRRTDQHPNPLLYAANRSPKMGQLYDQYLDAWHQAGGKTFVHFSAPRFYSWYGSWGAKEYITQPRDKAPKYDALLKYIERYQQPDQH